MDEKDLIDRLRQGDEEALRALLRRHTPLLRYVLKPLLPDERDREECLADISIKLWQNASFYDEKRGSFRTWLTVLARNSALNRLRAQHPEDVTLHEGLPHGDGTAEDALLRRERQQQLAAALSRLPSDERALFYRKYWYRQPTRPQHRKILCRQLRRRAGSVAPRRGGSALPYPTEAASGAGR